MALVRLSLRRLPQSSRFQRLGSCPGSSPSCPFPDHEGTRNFIAVYRNMLSSGFTHRGITTRSCNVSQIAGQNASNPFLMHSPKVCQLTIPLVGARYMSSSKVPAGAQQVSMKVIMQSPGFIYEPYQPPERIPFWRRWFTRSGWRRTKEDVIMEMKSAYAITRLKKVTGYSKKLFYQRAVILYKEINTLMANGDVSALRKLVTEKMHSTLKNEIKRRGTKWTSVYWELVEPVTSIRTLRARMIAIDKDELDKAFVQLTLEFIAKQRFEAYGAGGVLLSGDKSREVLVRDIWVFERSLFHPGADWRLCGRIRI